MLLTVFIVDSVINFTPNSVRLGERPYRGCADIFGLYYKGETNDVIASSCGWR